MIKIIYAGLKALLLKNGDERRERGDTPLPVPTEQPTKKNLEQKRQNLTNQKNHKLQILQTPTQPTN